MSEFEPLLSPKDASTERLEKIALVGEVMLRDLHDMTSKWGNRHAQRDDLYILNPEDFGVESEILVSAKADSEDLRLVVKKGEDNILQVAIPPSTRGDLVTFVLGERQVIEETALGISYSKSLPKILVIYDTQLSLEEVFNFVAEMAVMGTKKVLVDKEGKYRENPDRKYFVPTKLKVEEVFKEEGSYISILPGDEISESLEEFDSPEELVIVENPYTGTPNVITHKKWGEYFELKFSVANDVFLEMGINPLDLAGASTLDAKTFEPLIERVSSEIESRTKEAWAKRKNPIDITGNFS